MAQPLDAALTPDSPEVKQSVAKAVGYLSEQGAHGQLGGDALVGLAILKATNSAEHPAVQAQGERVSSNVMAATSMRLHNNYSVGIAIIFLANLDPAKYKEPLDRLMTEMLSRQMTNGAWGYEGRRTGDTSMVQYAVLSLWEAGRSGATTPPDAWEGVANWLLRTQDPSGGFGYQADDPGNFNLVKQPEVRPSLTAGALASIYLCADRFGLVEESNAEKVDNLPAALQPAGKPAQPAPARQRRTSSNIDVRRLADSLQMGKEWFDTHWNMTDPSQKYYHYFLYAMERYQTFREVFGGPDEPRDWYDEAARVLIDTQGPTGAWSGATGSATDTAFAVLFLVRSTRKALGPRTFGGGSMVGGRGIPKSDGPLRMQGGDIVASPLKASADQLLTMMEDADDPASVQAAEAFYQVAQRADEETLNKHLVQLKKLAGSERPEARVAAIKAIGRRRQLDDVPTLLFALTDPDTRVVGATVEALRYISRQPYGSPGTVVTDQASRDTALAYWKKWYREIRPNADLSDINP